MTAKNQQSQGSNKIKPPEEWTTGEEPMTGNPGLVTAQRWPAKPGEPLKEDLTKAEGFGEVSTNCSTRQGEGCREEAAKAMPGRADGRRSEHSRQIPGVASARPGLTYTREAKPTGNNHPFPLRRSQLFLLQ